MVCNTESPLSSFLAPAPDFRILTRTHPDSMDYKGVWAKGAIHAMDTVEPIREMQRIQALRAVLRTGAMDL